MVTADEIEVPHELRVRLWVNEDLKQNRKTNDLAHKIPRIIEWVNSIHDLEWGGVSDTGTNHRGLSALKDGDRTDMESRPGHPAVQCQGRAEAHLGRHHAPNFWQIRLAAVKLSPGRLVPAPHFPLLPKEPRFLGRGIASPRSVDSPIQSI